MLKFGKIAKLLNGGTFKFSTSFEISARVEERKSPEDEWIIKNTGAYYNESGTVGVIPAKGPVRGIHI